MQKITILGIGNIIMQDEGLGVRAVEALQKKYRFSAEVQLLDGGCLGMELHPFFEGTEKLLVIDAVENQLMPGSCCKYSGNEVKKYFRRKLSVHEVGLSEVLATLEVTGREIPEVVIIGMRPEVIDLGLELSATVARNMPELLDIALEQLKEWQVTVLEEGEVA